MTRTDVVTESLAADRFSHETLFYRHDEDFLAGVAGFVREGIERDDTVVVVEPTARLDLLREAVGADGAAVRWLDMTDVGANPARILPFWTAAVSEHLASGRGAAGRGLRGVGEPAFPGRRPQELVECAVHEALLNHAFDAGPGWRLLCPYDEAGLPAQVRDGALRNHRTWTGPDGGGPSPAFGFDSDTVADLDLATLDACAPLPPPTDVVLRGDYGPRDVPAVRRTVGQYARSCGLSADRVEALELAATELSTNSIRYGGGTGSVALWREPDSVVVEFRDGGRLTDPLIGRRRPDPAQDGGMGVFLVNQLCDLVQLRTSAEGTVVRISTWLQAAGR